MKKRCIGIISDLHIREAGDGSDSRIIEGYALKFNVRSRLLCDWWERYYEVLEPGCVTREMLDEQDIKLTMYHDRQILLARSKEGKGTLSYEVDDTGVKFWAEMPLTEHGTEALELVKRGDIAGCSFIYSTDEDDNVNAVSYERITEDGEQILLRHVKRIDNVYDFTITTDPAYEQTSVSRREVEDAGVCLEPQREGEDVEPNTEDVAEPVVGEGEGVEPTDDTTHEDECEKDKREQDIAKRSTIREARELIKRIFV